MAVALARPRRSRNPIVAEDRRAGCVFVAPAMLVFRVFIFGAILFAFYVSLHEYKLLDRGGIRRSSPTRAGPGSGLRKLSRHLQ